jgi:hypothetical protein
MQMSNKAFRQARRFGAIMLAAISVPALATDHWLAVEGMDCAAWSDQPLQPGEVIRWSGGCENGRLSGQGILEVTASGKRQLHFEGTMSGGKANGEGVFEGQEQGGKTQGADGSRYQGELSMGVPQGEGFEVTADGAAYHGDFSAGERHGHGALLFVDGGIYEGGFEDGKAHGKGVFTNLFGDTVEGTWNAGMANGEFIVTKGNGTVEHQIWRNDQQVADSGKGGGK